VARTHPPEISRDPRYLPFRVAAYALYLVVVIVFSTLLISSVVRSVIAMTPGQSSTAGPVISVRACADRADDLWQQLDRQRQALSSESPAGATAQRWSEFRVAWLQRLRDAESSCALPTHSRRRLKTAFDRLEHLQDLYMTHAVQFAGEIGDTLDSFRLSLEAARHE